MKLARWRERAPILKGLPDSSFAYLESIAESAALAANEVMFEVDSPAEKFYLIDEGRVGLEISIPGRTPIVLETLGAGDMVGVSWLFPPYRWSWRARALTQTTVFIFDAHQIRGRGEVDRELAFHLYRTVAAEAVRRLQRARVQLLDIYSEAHQ